MTCGCAGGGRKGPHSFLVNGWSIYQKTSFAHVCLMYSTSLIMSTACWPLRSFTVVATLCYQTVFTIVENLTLHLQALVRKRQQCMQLLIFSNITPSRMICYHPTLWRHVGCNVTYHL